MPEENQPQVDDVKVDDKDGDTQPETDTKTDDLGAEKQPQEDKKDDKASESRTFSQEEFSKMESAKDKETAGIKAQLAQLTLRYETDKTERDEAAALAKDQREIDAGDITTGEATQRKEARTQNSELGKMTETMRRMNLQIEQSGRLLAAQDFGKQYELTPEQVAELLGDKEIKSPGDMKAKAADLALERERGETKKAKVNPEPKYDQGVGGGKGGAEPTTAKGLIKAGWEELAKKK